jgi:predicted transcriptional regulator
MDDFEEFLNESLQEQEFREEWEKSEIEYQITKMLVLARREKNLTQQELADITGVRQSNISRIENGSCMPSIATLETLAKGLNKTLKIELV